MAKVHRDIPDEYANLSPLEQMRKLREIRSAQAPTSRRTPEEMAADYAANLLLSEPETGGQP
jgi:hypothetical protein